MTEPVGDASERERILQSKENYCVQYYVKQEEHHISECGEAHEQFRTCSLEALEP